MMKQTEFYNSLNEKQLAEEMAAEVFSALTVKDEEEKQIAYDLYMRGENDHDRMRGAVRVAYSHFLRSLRHAELRGRDNHPVFNIYMQHWLMIAKKILPETAMNTLRQYYPEPNNTNVAFIKGSSNWYDFDN